MAEGRVIGKNNELPWHLPADLKHFKTITLGKPIIMGRRTHESIGRPLPGRANIVISRQLDYAAPGCVVCSSLHDALAAAQPTEEVMIIGGATIYAEALPVAQRMYLTLIEALVDGDTLFPIWEPDEWQELARESHPLNATNMLPYSFVILERKQARPER